jgi:REP-associated tyrosine transposase
MPLLRHYDNLGTVRFITFSCYRRLNLINDDSIRKIIIESLKYILEKYSIKIFAYVLMPDHIHLVILPPDKLKLGRVIGYFKSISGYRAISYLKERNDSILERLSVNKNGRKRYAFWLKRFYDHNCRIDKAIYEKIKYCHNNPVIRGLVKNIEDWKWSSYDWYIGKENVPIIMDKTDSMI